MTLWNGYRMGPEVLLHLTKMEEDIDMNIISVELDSGF